MTDVGHQLTTIAQQGCAAITLCSRILYTVYVLPS